MTWTVTLAAVLGWVSFAAWSISFYPQTVLMWRTQRSKGLSWDFLAYNLTGFVFYSVYTCVKFATQSTHSVDISDVAFAVHALVLVVVQCVQCLIYEKHEQQAVNLYHSFLCAVLWVLALYNVVLCTAGILPWLSGPASVYSCVDFLGYGKSLISLVKYIPQAYLNFVSRSTVGWSIENVWVRSNHGVLVLVISCFFLFLVFFCFADVGLQMGTVDCEERRGGCV
jgi:cystinosin